MTITFYDIPSKLAVKAWSPNPWKARLALNIKGLPYKTVWVEFPDIERVCKEIGAKPTGTTPSGTPLYTLPVLRDDTSNAVISDSFEIARYLDDQYPDTIPMFPKGSHALLAAFKEAHERIAIAYFYPLMGLTTVRHMNAPSEHYFRTKKGPPSGATFEEADLKGEARDEHWKKVREGHETIAGWFSKNEEGQFVMGKDVSFADAMLVAWLRMIGVIYGEESDEWKAVLSWQDGWWARYLKQFDQYLAIV